jgi:hypothetical protein
MFDESQVMRSGENYQIVAPYTDHHISYDI